MGTMALHGKRSRMTLRSLRHSWPPSSELVLENQQWRSSARNSETRLKKLPLLGESRLPSCESKPIGWRLSRESDLDQEIALVRSVWALLQQAWMSLRVF